MACDEASFVTGIDCARTYPARCVHVILVIIYACQVARNIGAAEMWRKVDSHLQNSKARVTTIFPLAFLTRRYHLMNTVS